MPPSLYPLPNILHFWPIQLSVCLSALIIYIINIVCNVTSLWCWQFNDISTVALVCFYVCEQHVSTDLNISIQVKTIDVIYFRLKSHEDRVWILKMETLYIIVCVCVCVHSDIRPESRHSHLIQVDPCTEHVGLFPLHTCATLLGQKKSLDLLPWSGLS